MCGQERQPDWPAMQEYRTRRRDVVLGVMMAVGVVAGWLALVCLSLMGFKL